MSWITSCCIILMIYLWLWSWCVNGDRIATFRQANLDQIAMFRHKYWIRLPCFDITMRSIATFRHKNGIELPHSDKLIIWVGVPWEDYWIVLCIYSWWLHSYLMMIDIERLFVALKWFNCKLLRTVELFVAVNDDDIVYVWYIFVL